MPKINPRQMQQMMHKMGINQNEIEAIEVIIRCADKDIVVTNPEVIKVDMMGQKMFQVSGTVSEKAREVEITEEDIKTVMEQANVDREIALNAIKDADGDLASAILKLSE